MKLTNQELIRYSRHSMLPQLGVTAQQKLKESRVLVLGTGGLGSPAALYLASAGVGTLVLADGDTVELSNLQRQVLHGETDINRPKVESAADSLRAINSDITIETINERLEGQALFAAVEAADAVVDCSDNFATRFAVNAACVSSLTPLISAAAIRGEGQITVFDSRDSGSPCYRCLYAEAEAGQENCSTQGVLAPLVGVMGSLQALETLKILTDNAAAVSRLLLFDAWASQWREIKLSRDPACPVCSASV